MQLTAALLLPFLMPLPPNHAHILVLPASAGDRGLTGSELSLGGWGRTHALTLISPLGAELLCSWVQVFQGNCLLLLRTWRARKLTLSCPQRVWRPLPTCTERRAGRALALPGVPLEACRKLPFAFRRHFLEPQRRKG